MGVLARQFDGRFVGLRAAVAEKNLVGKRMPDQQLRQLGLRLGVIQIGNMRQFIHLLLDGSNHLRMRMPEIADGNAGHQIEIFLAVDIPDPGARPFRQYDRKPPVRIHDIPCSLRYHFLFIHGPVLFVIF